jgi:hypothetical protein
MKTGDQLKAEGQAKAVKHAGSAWLDGAVARFRSYCYRAYCEGAADVTVDSFRLYSNPLLEPPNPSAWGALPRAACKAGFIKPTDRIEKAQRTAAQARVVRVWDIVPSAL